LSEGTPDGAPSDFVAVDQEPPSVNVLLPSLIEGLEFPEPTVK
jgi:hypothetical protein